MSRWFAICALCITSFVALPTGTAPAAQGDKASSVPYNILLITPDQLRADFMHTYGAPWPNTPNIDRLAGEGMVFLQAYSAGGWTTPSFGSILTGRFPTIHGMTLPPSIACGPSVTNPEFAVDKLPSPPPYMTLSKSLPILPEMLKPYGVATAVDIANCWAIWDVLTRGWDSIKVIPSLERIQGKLNRERYLTAPQTLEWAQKYLTAHQEERFFLWVHFMEPHSPYNAPREYDQFKTFEDFPNLFDDNSADSRELVSTALLGNVHSINRFRQLYAAKILYVDGYIGKLMDTVRDLGLDKNTIVILISDHGELLFSHPQDFNTTDHRSVYDADLHVPLILRGPGITAGRRVGAIVGQYDLVPTIVDLEHLPAPRSVDGTSLVPILEGKSTEVHRYVYAMDDLIEPQYAIRDSRYTLIETLRDGRIQCFDNLVDPSQTIDDCARVPEKTSELKAALDQHIEWSRQEAKSHADWENNLALAILEGRDSEGLQAASPAEITVIPPSGASHFQIDGRDWSPFKDSVNCMGVCYWAPPGPNNDYVVWRTDSPFIGEYEISVWNGDAPLKGLVLASNASFQVRFKGGVRSFPVDENRDQGKWNVLGRFRDPISVTLTNQANGPVVADAVRFLRVQR
jgi:arylsulfatase A-like enzyme